MTCSGLEAPPSCTRRCAPLWPSSLWSRRYLGDGWVTPDERSISGETEDVLPGGRATETSMVMGSGHDGGGDRVCRSPRGSGEEGLQQDTSPVIKSVTQAEQGPGRALDPRLCLHRPSPRPSLLHSSVGSVGLCFMTLDHCHMTLTSVHHLASTGLSLPICKWDNSVLQD